MNTQEIKMGDSVQDRYTKKEGIVLSVSRKNVKIQTEKMILITKIDNLKLVDCKEVYQMECDIVTVKSSSIADKVQFKSEIDLHGLRLDEAMNLVEKHIDRAICLGENRVCINHGKGQGTLRKYVQDYVKKHKDTLKLDEHNASYGEGGISYIYIK